MKHMSDDELARTVMGMAELDGPFEPQATYIPEGDCIEFLAANDDYYAERIDGLVTVYYSRETGQIIGSLIKGVRAFCQKILKQYPGFKIEIEDQRIKLEHIFRAKLWSQEHAKGDMIVKTYRKLIQVAEDADVQAELSGV